MKPNEYNELPLGEQAIILWDKGKFIHLWGVSRRSIERYIVFAQDLVARRMQRRERIVESVRADIIAREAETWLKSTLELEARLCAIVSGKVVFEKTLKRGKEVQQVETKPTCSEVINAIDILLRLRGAYKIAEPIGDDTPVMKIFVRDENEKKIVEAIQERARSGK